MIKISPIIIIDSKFNKIENNNYVFNFSLSEEQKNKLVAIFQIMKQKGITKVYNIEDFAKEIIINFAEGNH